MPGEGSAMNSHSREHAVRSQPAFCVSPDRRSFFFYDLRFYIFEPFFFFFFCISSPSMHVYQEFLVAGSVKNNIFNTIGMHCISLSPPSGMTSSILFYFTVLFDSMQ